MRDQERVVPKKMNQQGLEPRVAAVKTFETAQKPFSGSIEDG